MAYLHCHICYWSQDDFYDENYNPAKSLNDWNEYLFGKRKDKLDEPFADDPEFLYHNGPITIREVIAQDYEKYANRIREMRWVSQEDFKRDYNRGDAKCPKCGNSHGFDID